MLTDSGRSYPEVLIAQHDFTTLLDALKAWLPDSRILAHAHSSGFLQRHRKLDFALFVWTLILGFSCGSQRSLFALARTYQAALGHEYNRSSFYRKLDSSCARMMRSLLDLVLARLPRSGLAGFDSVLTLDATLVHLWQDTSTEMHHSRWRIE